MPGLCIFPQQGTEICKGGGSEVIWVITLEEFQENEHVILNAELLLITNAVLADKCGTPHDDTE